MADERAHHDAEEKRREPPEPVASPAPPSPQHPCPYVEHLAQATADREGISTDEATARWTREIPMQRLGEPAEFAALAAFLCSARASYITASSIPVDGGWIKALL